MSDIAIEVNCETGEVIERPLTAEEIAERKAAADQAAAQKAIEAAEAAAQAEAKTALLARLGLTAEEADLLFK